MKKPAKNICSNTQWNYWMDRSPSLGRYCWPCALPPPLCPVRLNKYEGKYFKNRQEQPHHKQFYICDNLYMSIFLYHFTGNIAQKHFLLDAPSPPPTYDSLFRIHKEYFFSKLCSDFWDTILGQHFGKGFGSCFGCGFCRCKSRLQVGNRFPPGKNPLMAWRSMDCNNVIVKILAAVWSNINNVFFLPLFCQVLQWLGLKNWTSNPAKWLKKLCLLGRKTAVVICTTNFKPHALHPKQHNQNFTFHIRDFAPQTPHLTQNSSFHTLTLKNAHFVFLRHSLCHFCFSALVPFYLCPQFFSNVNFYDPLSSTTTKIFFGSFLCPKGLQWHCPRRLHAGDPRRPCKTLPTLDILFPTTLSPVFPLDRIQCLPSHKSIFFPFATTLRQYLPSSHIIEKITKKKLSFLNLVAIITCYTDSICFKK